MVLNVTFLMFVAVVYFQIHPHQGMVIGQRPCLLSGFKANRDQTEYERELPPPHFGFQTFHYNNLKTNGVDKLKNRLLVELFGSPRLYSVGRVSAKSRQSDTSKFGRRFESRRMVQKRGLSGNFRCCYVDVMCLNSCRWGF